MCLRSRRSFVASALGVAGLWLFTACNNTLGLPPATSANTVDTVTLYAIHGTTLTAPSGYAIIGRAAVRTDQTILFDFAFDFDSLGQAVFVPTGALRFARADSAGQPGFQYTGTSFDNMTLAPTDGYVVDKPLLADSTKVTLARSRAETCPDGTTNPLYAKLQVLSTNAAARSVRFVILADQNCGYRGLAPGLPGQ